MTTHKFSAWDDYYIPHSTVLRNKFTSPSQPYGVSDPQLLERLELGFAGTRLIELKQRPIAGNFDYAHMQAIHRYLFQDVYEWAGEPRRGPDTSMVKQGPNVLDPADPTPRTYAYYPGNDEMNRAAEARYTELANEHYLHGLDRDTFITRLAEYWGELNVIHAFREGNTRSQMVFFAQLAHEAGYELDQSRFRIVDAATQRELTRAGRPNLREAFVNARFYSQATGQNDRLARVLAAAVQRRY
ncbi:Fic/DOC family protein [Gulosibacter bifidus]|uniref:protein adenylyltransferase n=1 Tax=Gulosibacter bifidus TaxID=272239 RepID=A0ABW5RIC4_9MICO|nr:Fic family protein [Gulosibacter bifidus]